MHSISPRYRYIDEQTQYELCACNDLFLWSGCRTPYRIASTALHKSGPMARTIFIQYAVGFWGRAHQRCHFERPSLFQDYDRHVLYVTAQRSMLSRIVSAFSLTDEIASTGSFFWSFFFSALTKWTKEL